MNGASNQQHNSHSIRINDRVTSRTQHNKKKRKIITYRTYAMLLRQAMAWVG